MTDAVPRDADERREFQASDIQWILPLPPAEPFQALCAALKAALSTGERKPAKQAARRRSAQTPHRIVATHHADIPT